MLHAALRETVATTQWVDGSLLQQRFPRAVYGRYASLLDECEAAGLEGGTIDGAEEQSWFARRRA